MFTTIFAIYLLLAFIVFSLVFYLTQTFHVTNVLSVSVYGAVNGSSQIDETREDSTAVDCKKGYQLEGYKCVRDCPDYYNGINSKCPDTWIGGMDKNSSDVYMGNNTITHGLGNLNFTETNK